MAKQYKKTEKPSKVQKFQKLELPMSLAIDAPPPQPFTIKFRNAAQRYSWKEMSKHDVVFLLGPAGTGKTHLACAYAIRQILDGNQDKIVLTRPIVESGRSLGYLPGTFNEKVLPYMRPMNKCIAKCVGTAGPFKEQVDKSIEVSPLAYMRGDTYDDSVCLFDEAQNATEAELKLFITRLGSNSKMIITGDPMQSDLPTYERGLMSVVDRLTDLEGVGIVRFELEDIVRHPLLSSIITRLERPIEPKGT